MKRFPVYQPCVFFATSIFFFSCKETPAYLNTALSFDWLSRPTLEKKVALFHYRPNIDLVWRRKPSCQNMNQGEFSVRWKGVLVPPVSGGYALGGKALSGDIVYMNK